MKNVRNNKIIKKKYLQFFFSMLLSVLCLQVTTIIDTIIVGNAIGTMEMSGVKSASPIINFVSVFATLLGVGSGMVISIALGKRNNKRANYAFTTGIFFSIVIGLIITFIGIFLSKNIMSIVISDDEILTFGQTYCEIVLSAAPLLILASYLGYAIRSDGYTKLSMILLITGGLVNVTFDLIFILGFDMGVKGAAIATDMSYLISTLIAVIYLFMKNRTLHFINIFKDKNEFKDVSISIFKSGLPSSLRLLFYSISIMISNYVIGKYIGYMGIAVLTVATNIGLISSVVFQSSGAAMMPVMGVLYGEHDYRGIKMLISYVIRFLLIAVFVIVVLVISLAGIIYDIFGISNYTSEYTFVLRIYAIGFIFAGLNYIFIYYYSTLQKPFIAILISSLEQIIIYIPLIISLTPSMGLNALLVTYLVSEGATFIITLLVLYLIKKKKNYENILLLPKKENDILLDFTALASLTNASLISEDVGKILLENNIDNFKANKTSLILEEMIMNIKNVQKKNKKTYVDVKIIKENENLIISLRSNGYPFDPLIESEDLSLKLINSISLKIKYNQVIGFNQTLIEV